MFDFRFITCAKEFNYITMQSTSSLVLRTVLRKTYCRCRNNTLQIRQALGCIGSSSSRLMSTEPLPAPNTNEKTYSPKITQLVNDISQLSLLEVADLNDLLKKTLNIQDAPMMAMAQAAPAAKAEEEEEIEQPKGKTTFTVKLTGFAPDKKVALIKEIKSLIPGSNLVQAKKFVEATPSVVKEDLPKEDAEELVKKLEAVGGKATLD